MAIEGRIARGEERGCFQAFRAINDELFALMILHDFDDFPRIKALLPKWPDNEFWAKHLGELSPNDSLKEACAFWGALKNDYSRLTGRDIGESAVVDFGSGWGRISRLSSKDVPATRLFAVDPNAELLKNAADCGVQCQYVVSDWHSNEQIMVPGADLIFSFGVFTHASPELARRMFQRLADIANPGALLTLTVRPGAMLYADRGETVLFSSDAIDRSRDEYLEGKHVFLPYEEGTDWGVAFSPRSWLSSAAAPWFRLLEERPFLQNWTHKIVHFVKA